MMRIPHQFDHLQIDHREAEELPGQELAHEAGELRRLGRIVGLLVGLFVGDGHRFHLPGCRWCRRVALDQSGSNDQPGRILA